LLLGSFNSLKHSDEKKERQNFALNKKQGERKICEEKELNKYLSFANRRCITEDKERQLKAIN
jgi:hypothetical protein